MEYGGWLHSCGHFNRSDFLQIAKDSSRCEACRAAGRLLAQAKKLKATGLTQEPLYKVTLNNHITEPKRRTPSC